MAGAACRRTLPALDGGEAMAKAFSRTTRALSEDLAVRPRIVSGLAVLLGLVWLAWFTTPSLPGYDLAIAARLSGTSHLGAVLEPSGGATRFDTARLWEIRARFTPAQIARIRTGQLARLQIADDDNRPLALTGTVAGPDYDDAQGVRIEVASDRDLGQWSGRPVAVRVQTALQSPLARVLGQPASGAGATVGTP
ncbi:MAG: hypothetical protein GC191_11755 [Azospirillum sp.]|nr:hypothetical protein [Azospirillum sp.]